MLFIEKDKIDCNGVKDTPFVGLANVKEFYKY
jgi:hypothetical protein